MERSILFVVLAGTLLIGCATAPTPQTAAEYRQGVANGGRGTSIDSYVVNKPYKKVVATLKAKAKECLNVKLVQTHCVSTRSSKTCKDRGIFYTPTVTSTPAKTELHVQFRREPADAIFLGGNPPPKGMYIAVADAVPAAKGKTRMTVYASTGFFTKAPAAIKHWVNGTNLGCPDFSKGY